jgi:hypothetical protein
MNRAALVEAFAGFPERLGAAALAAADRPVSTGEWGSAETIRHLIAVEDEVWQVRFGQIASGHHPQWTWTEPGLALGMVAASLAEMLATFAARRASTVATVRGFDADAWERSGTHETYGVLDVAKLLRLANDHGEEHLAALRTRD